MKKGRNLWAIILFVLWTVFIFARSMQPAELSKEESGQLLVFLQQMVPFELTQHMIRKAAHFVEYGILGFLGWFIFDMRRGWERSVFAVSLCSLIALCDETIQLFVEGRAGMVEDIWLDMSGVLAGVLAGVVLHRLFCRFHKK